MGRILMFLVFRKRNKKTMNLTYRVQIRATANYQFKIYHMKRLIQIPDFDCTVTEEYGRQLLADMRTYASDSDNSRETSTHLPRDRWQES